MGEKFDPFKSRPDPGRPLAGLSNEELAALGEEVGVHVGFPDPIPPPTPPPPPPRDADPDEEPPEQEGHVLSKTVADWIARNGGQEFFHGPLPPDVAAIWGHPPHRAADEATARILISTWGLDEFRSSALHKTALAEKARTANTAGVTARFKAEREQKAKRR